MDKPDWATAVQIMYREAPKLISGEIDTTHPFVTEGDLTEDTARDTLLSLDEWGLVEKQPKTLTPTPTGDIETTEFGYKLTKDGFDVAHERELSRRDNSISQSLVFLTFILVLAEIVGVVPADDWVKVITGFIILIGMLFIVYWTDMLEP